MPMKSFCENYTMDRSIQLFTNKTKNSYQYYTRVYNFQFDFLSYMPSVINSHILSKHLKQN